MPRPSSQVTRRRPTLGTRQESRARENRCQQCALRPAELPGRRPGRDRRARWEALARRLRHRTCLADGGPGLHLDIVNLSPRPVRRGSPSAVGRTPCSYPAELLQGTWAVLGSGRGIAAETLPSFARQLHWLQHLPCILDGPGLARTEPHPHRGDQDPRARVNASRAKAPRVGEQAETEAAT